MKALVMNEYKKLDYSEVEAPVLRNSHDVLIRVKAVSICGSDVHGFDGSTGRRIPPIIMGHEAAGEIVEIGADVAGFAVGDRVTFDSTEYCGTCAYCRKGEVNLCDNRMVLGVSCDDYRRHGAFAELVVVADRILYKLPEGISWDDAAMVEPAAVAAHALNMTPIALNDTVAVVGTGLIGLLLIQILKASGSGKIIALDTEASRRESAIRFGADAALDPAAPGFAARIAELAPGGVDRVFEAVGATRPIATAIEIVRKGGSVTLIGNVSKTVEIPLQAVVTKQIKLQGSCAIAGEYSIVLDLIARKKIRVDSLLSATAPLSEGQVWFEKLYTKDPTLLKVVLHP